MLSPHAILHRCGFKNVGLQPLPPPKIAQNGNFLYKFAPKGKFYRVHRKTWIQTFLYAVTLQLFRKLHALLNSVSVFTNFDIRKRDKEKNTKKHHTFPSTGGAWRTMPTILGTVIEEVRVIFAPSNFSDPISSFEFRYMWNYWKCVRKCLTGIRWKRLNILS